MTQTERDSAVVQARLIVTNPDRFSANEIDAAWKLIRAAKEWNVTSLRLTFALAVLALVAFVMALVWFLPQMQAKDFNEFAVPKEGLLHHSGAAQVAMSGGRGPFFSGTRRDR